MTGRKPAERVDILIPYFIGNQRENARTVNFFREIKKIEKVVFLRYNDIYKIRKK